MTAKDLKNALLQEAVQGKLVPQIASEGNARDLLEEIRKSHTDLQIPTESAGNKKGDLRSKSQIRVTKKEKNLPEILEEEVPFDIPESWCWCRLEELCELIEDCPHSTVKDEGHGYPLIRTPNIGEGRLLLEGVHRVSEENYKKRNVRATPKTNDLIFAREAPAGNIAVIQANEIVCLGQRTVLIRPIEQLLVSDFLAYYILSPDTQKNLVKKAAGTTVAHVNMADIRPYFIPLPPLAEQKRIVTAIEKFMPLIEEYGKKETVLNELNAQIGTLTKKAILQEAVQGKLVPQIASEGNARDLLEEIRKSHTDLQIPTESAGKKKGDLRSKSQIRVTKKANVLPEITEDEIPFDIPENWCWCRLGEICKFLSRGKSPKYSEIKKYPVFAQKCNLKDGEISLDQAQFLDPEVLPKWKEEYKIQDGDVLVNSTGTGTVMRTRYFKSEYLGNYPFVVPDSHVTVIRTFPEINSKYIFYCCFGFAVQKYWEENLAGSTNQKELYIGVVGNTPIPLPPLAEQKRIVEAIEQLLPLCERLGK